MKVVCINDAEQGQAGDDMPSVKKGNIYTVVEKIYQDYGEDDDFVYEAGYYYTFVETGAEVSYHESMFIEINESTIDETEFERNYSKQPVNV